MDISADLMELGTTDVCVISAGVKSILDIGRTLEYLETLGVPVVAYGQDDFPAFYTRDSGFRAPLRLDSPDSAAEMMRIKWDLGLKGGAIIGNPIAEEYAMSRFEIDAAIEKALQTASEQSVAGRDITPFLLDRIKTLTEGRSLEANKQLVYSNARLAAEIAAAYYGKN
jgi:pseudouridine-5'-phosphate glycosidase